MKNRAVFWLSLALTFTPVSFAFGAKTGEEMQSDLNPNGILCEYAKLNKPEFAPQTSSETQSIKTQVGSGQ